MQMVVAMKTGLTMDAHNPVGASGVTDPNEGVILFF
jgi:hypothetical protein